MAYFYMDTDAADDLQNGTTWALAGKTLETSLAFMAAGDTLFVQGAAADDLATDRTLTSVGTALNPCKIIGVVDGTTNTGASVVTSDLAVTLPIISTTGAAPDINFQGNATYSHLDFSIGDRGSVAANVTIKIINSKLSLTDRFTINIGASMELESSDYESLAALGEIGLTSTGRFKMTGGTLIATASADILRAVSAGSAELTGVDLSALNSANGVVEGTGTGVDVILKNCKMAATYNLFVTSPTTAQSSAVAIGCDNTSTIGATSSIQSYSSETTYGTVVDEQTVVRTGGADDGTGVGFSYAITPTIDATVEGSTAAVKSPWLNVWVAGGSTTLTVYISNSAAEAAANDFHQDEVWVEFYTPDAGDTAQHDQTFFPASERLLDSEVSITDDTGSTWGTGGNNDQKFSATVTTGFEGFAYARLHYAKRFASSPATLYLDPKIIVT